MTIEHERRIFAAVKAILDAPPERRHELLERSCDGDARMRAEIAALVDDALRAEVDADTDRESGIAARVATALRAPNAPSVLAAWRPETVGRYRIVREIGRGGMGIVYEAEQDTPRRAVALKLLHPLYASSGSQRRLEREAEFLARLQHPGIAQVHDAGVVTTAHGEQPFIAMELVDGVDLAMHARGLDARARIELVARIAEAVGHAHERGIVHRDLKPGNVLVDRRGNPRVLDFGVARSFDADVQRTTMATEAGAILGTIAYMSPEQVSGEVGRVDARSDVHALGAILFELLAGRLPWIVDGVPMARALERIRTEDAPRLGALAPSARGDVETIVGKALEKDPERRYADAHELAADLRHALGDEPIAARRPSRVYQIEKFARRNRAVVTGVAVAFAALAVGLAVSVAKSIEATNEARKVRAVNTFLVQRLLASPDPGRSGRDVRVLDLFDGARAAVDETFRDDPDLRAETKHTLGTSYLRLVELVPAAELLEEAVDLRTREFGSDAVPTLESKLELARAWHGMNRLEDAERLYAEIEAVRARREGEDAPETIAARTGRAEALFQLGRRDEGVALARSTSADADRRLGVQHERARAALITLVYMLRDGIDLDGAEARARELVDREARAGGADSPGSLRARQLLAETHYDQGRNADAEREMRGIVASLEGVYGGESLAASDARAALASWLADEGRFEEARAIDERELAIHVAALGPSNRATLMIRNNLAVVLRRLGRLEDAEREALLVLEMRRKTLGPRHREVASSLNTLGAIRVLRGDHAAADRDLSEALETGRAELGPEHPQVATTLFNLAELRRKRGDFAAAEAAFRELLALDTKSLDARHPTVLSDRLRVAQCAAGQGRHAEVEVEMRALLAIRAADGSADNLSAQVARIVLARALAEQGRGDEALEHLERALAVLEAGKQRDAIDDEDAYGLLARIHRAAGRDEEADAAERKDRENDAR